MMGKYFYFIINKKSTLDHDLKKNSGNTPKFNLGAN